MSPDQRRSRRPPWPRKLTLRPLQVRRDALAEPPAPLLERPVTRADCKGAERPCPWVGCAHHLALEVSPCGGLTIHFPGLELEELPETCALDVADRRGAPPPEVARALNLTRERVRQLELSGLAKLERHHPHLRALLESGGIDPVQQQKALSRSPDGGGSSPGPVTPPVTSAEARSGGGAGG